MNIRKKTVCGVLAVILALTFAACGDDGGGGGSNIAVTFSSVSANGSSSQTTTQLTLTFSQTITGLSAEDISLSGVSNVSKGTLSGSGPTYTLPVSGFTSGGNLSVSVSKAGYDISGSPKSTTIYYYGSGGSSDITYTVTQTGGEDGVTDSTGIIFTFSASVDSLNLTASDITIGGTASKGTTELTGTGTTRTLAITVNGAGTAMVTINKIGIEAETKHVTVYKEGDYAPALTSITAVYTGTAAIYPTTPLDDLKADLTVKAQYNNSPETTLSSHEYTLSGTLIVGTSTVTVSYTDVVTKTTTFSVTVTDKTLTGITLNTTSVEKAYSQNQPLDLSGLVVTASYSDSTSAVVTTYTSSPVNGATLSTVGTITVTVSYTEGTVTKTADFNVSVSDPSHIHQWGAWTQTTAATETTDGEETRTCSIDSTHKETRAIRATGTTGLSFSLINNNAAYSVSKGTVTSGVVHIPAYRLYEGNYLPVTEIDENAFYETNITSVYIPASVTSIGIQAFIYCTSLTSITIPEGITSIGGAAFFNCTSLTSIIIPASVTSIVGNWPFYGWTSSQTIYVLGYTNQAAADTAWGSTWSSYCNAVIIYNGQFVVNFNSNGGSMVNPITVEPSGTISAPASPTKTGFTFGGWYKDSELTTPWVFASDTVTDNITLYAKWGFAVNFNSNGGSAVARIIAEQGGTISEPASPTRAGCTFGGWYKESSFTTLWNFASDTVTQNITLYAKWNVTVTFNSNGGSAVTAQTITYGSTATRPGNPTKTDFFFVDWYSNQELTTVYNFATQVTGAITLYAKWGIAATTLQDIDDFGSGAIIADFTVTNATEWNSARNSINTSGNNKNYIINITADFSLSGVTSSTFTPTNIIVSIRGSQTVTLSGNGSLLRTAQNQRVIVRDLTLQGGTNNTSLVYINIGTLELRGTAKITGNNYISTATQSNVQVRGSGVFVENGTFLMRDNSSISGNTILSENYNASGAGVYIIGDGCTFIMRENSSIKDNIIENYSISDGSGGGGIYVVLNAKLLIEGGTISGNIASTRYQSSNSLYLSSNASAQRGYFTGDTWTSLGNLGTTNNDIIVVNGVLQP